MSPGTVSFERGSRIAVLATIICLCSPVPVLGYGGNLGLGVAGGYVTTGRLGERPPATVDGGGFGVHLTYGFNESWGLCLEGNFDWHAPYTVYVLDEIADETEDETTVGYVEGATVERSFATSIALSVLYIVDVMRLMPYLGAGVIGARYNQKWGQTPIVGYDLGFRVTIGADFALLEYLSVGVVLHNDNYLVGNSDFYTRLEIMARVTFIFDVGKFGREPEPG